MDGLMMFTVKIIVIIFLVSMTFGFVKETFLHMGEKGKAIGEDLGKKLVLKIPEVYSTMIDKLSGVKPESKNKTE